MTIYDLVDRHFYLRLRNDDLRLGSLAFLICLSLLAVIVICIFTS